MTWDELKAHIEVMDEEQRGTDVTVYDMEMGEFFKVLDIDFSQEDDVLDKNHPFLNFPVED